METYGITPTHAAAGFGGALASLPFTKPTNRWAVLGTITGGLVTAMFLTPIFVDILSSPKLLGYHISEKGEMGMAFLLGLTAMILIPAILAAVTWVKDNISRLMERVTGVSPKPPGDQ